MHLNCHYRVIVIPFTTKRLTDKSDNRVVLANHLNRLTLTENDFNRALADYLPGDQQSISQVVEAMGKSVKEIRRSQAAEIFS